MKTGKITDLYEVVKKLLEAHPKYRDSDEKLVARIIADDLEKRGIDIKQISAYKFLCMYAECKLVKTESVTRARRRVQEENPSLRGTRYVERQDSQNELVKDVWSLV